VKWVELNRIEGSVIPVSWLLLDVVSHLIVFTFISLLRLPQIFWCPSTKLTPYPSCTTQAFPLSGIIGWFFPIRYFIFYISVGYFMLFSPETVLQLHFSLECQFLLSLVLVVFSSCETFHVCITVISLLFLHLPAR